MPHSASSPAITLPKATVPHDAMSMHLCHGFLHHYNGSTASTDQRIHKAITTLAQHMATTPAMVARKLVENGLRAGPECFPEDFITELKQRSTVPAWSMNGASASERELMDSWKTAHGHIRAPQPNGYKRVEKI